MKIFEIINLSEAIYHHQANTRMTREIACWKRELSLFNEKANAIGLDELSAKLEKILKDYEYFDCFYNNAVEEDAKLTVKWNEVLRLRHLIREKIKYGL